MFKKLMAGLKALTRTPTPVDPKRFNDPLAERTQWEPAARGGASFCTRKLVEAGAGRVEFRATFGMKAFSLLFLLVGLAAAAAGVFGFFALDASVGRLGTLVPLIVGLIFAGAGGGMLYAVAESVVFDQQRSLFYRGSGRAAGDVSGRLSKDFVELSYIHALQLISEYVRGDKSSYYSYELNLVLDDASRVNVIDHGNLEQIRKDAHRLSQFLGKPVWDAINNR